MSSGMKILLVGLAIMPVIVIIIMNIMQGKRMKQNLQARREEIEALKVGMKVMTVSGIYGTIRAIDTERVRLEIAQNTIIEVNKASIVGEDK